MKASLTLLILCFAATVYGQRVTGTNEITLDEAIKTALEKNYTTRNAINSLSSAQYQRSKAGDNLLPTVTGSASYGYTDPLTAQGTSTFNRVSFVPGPNAVPPSTNSISYSLGASFNIFNGGFDASNISAADYSLDAAKYNLKWVRQSVAYNVIAAYVNALRYKELLDVTQKSLDESQAQLDRTKGLFSAGSVPVGQVYQQEALVGQQKVARIAAQNNYLNAKTDLLFILNIAPDSYDRYDVTLRGIDTSITSLTSKSNDVAPSSSLVESLLNSREDLAALRASIHASESQIGETRALLYPSLNATLGLSGSPVASRSLTKMSIDHNIVAGLRLTVPIFDAFQNRLQIDIQEVQIDISRTNLEQSEQQFRSDIAKAQNNLRSATESLDATKSALISAEESLRSAEERLRVGAGIQVDVIVAEAQAISARTDRVNATYNYLLSLRQLQYLLDKTNY